MTGAVKERTMLQPQTPSSFLSNFSSDQYIRSEINPTCNKCELPKIATSNESKVPKYSGYLYDILALKWHVLFSFKVMLQA